MHKTSSIADLAMVLTKNTKLRVTISGEGSHISQDGNHMNIARMEDTPVGRMLTTGLIVHETSHCNYSDLSSKPSGLVGHITNIIEDIRVESLITKERPGASFHLNEVMNHYVAKGGLNPKTLNDAICGKVMSYGRNRFLRQTGIATIEPMADEIMSDAFDDEFIQELVDIANMIPALTSSADSISLAQKVHDLVLQQQDKPNPSQQGQGNEKTTEQEEKGDADDQERTDQSSDGEAMQDQLPEEPDSGGSSEEPENNPEGKEDISEGAESSTSSTEPSSNTNEGVSEGSGAEEAPASPECAIDGATEQQIKELLAEESDYGDLGKMIRDETNSMESDNISTPLLPGIHKDTEKHARLDEVQAISASSRMRAKMMGMLQDVKRQPESFGATGKKLATNRLHKIALGDPRIFNRKIEVKDINTAIVIAIDYSGSMRGRTEISNPAAYAIHNALFGLKGAATASIGFGCEDENYEQKIMVLVDFKQKPKSDMFNLDAAGSTPTDEAIWAARAMLLSRPEPRKILLIITDGGPDDWGKTISATKQTEKTGIETAAIGVLCPCVKELWKNSKVVNTLEELAPALFAIMDDLLVQRRTK